MDIKAQGTEYYRYYILYYDEHAEQVSARSRVRRLNILLPAVFGALAGGLFPNVVPPGRVSDDKYAALGKLVGPYGVCSSVVFNLTR